MTTSVGLDKKGGNALIAQLITGSLISQAENGRRYSLCVQRKEKVDLVPLQRDVPEPPTEHGTIERAWIESHSQELSQFADEWIVVEGEQLVAHDPDFANAAKKARAQGVHVPYVTRIHSLGKRLSIGYQWKSKKSI